MIKSLLTLCSVFSVSFCFGQYRHSLINDTSIYNKYAFAIIKLENQPEIKAHNYVLDYSTLTGTKIDSNGEYSKKGDYISVYTFEHGVKILDTYQLLAKYISKKYRDLPVYIDSVLVRHSESAYYQLSAIVSVKVQTDKITGLKYINVHSIHHGESPVADTYMYGTYRKGDN